ncbi:DinB family protein [Thermogemmatispora sp.]|uniref:DinB family protein n=1 Tax=Thermogemmatispora sp. TaxID=1968838 RepID=UPI001D765381|nr:DinB family protein [Thermogemmatispora sp.]MBX5451529.1 DinB family protein [Thermogemmatispora sp.]
MNIIEFFRLEQRRLHEWMRNSVSDLSVEEWHYQGPGRVNTIAFLLWHCVRTEDNILRFILQGRQPIWNEEEWPTRLGLPPRVQGTGMSTEEARQLRIADPSLFMEYAARVWQEFEDYLAAVKDGGAELSARIVKVKPLGEMPAIQAIGQICLTHCFTHLGEIAHIRGELGKPGMPI